MTRQSASLRRSIRDVQRSLKSLDEALRRFIPAVAAVTANGGSPMKPGAAHRSPLSHQRHAVLELQGRYMGFMRQLKPRQKAQVRKVREMKGLRAAIERAKYLNRA